MTRSRSDAQAGRRRALVAVFTLLVGLLVLAPGPGAAGAGTAIKSGNYSGSTDQDAVASSFKQVQFTVRKGKVTLTTEPTVARASCLSTPVFTLGGTTATKKLSKNRSFTFTHTFLGNKFDKIHGQFVSSTKVEGYAIYHFVDQDLCTDGKTKVDFSAKRK